MLAMYPLKDGEKIFKGMHVAMLALFVLLTVYVVLLNPGGEFPIILWALVYLGLSLARHFLLVAKKYHVIQLIMPYIEGFALILLNSADPTNNSLSLFMVHIADIAIDYDHLYSIAFSVAGYIAYMVNFVKHLPDLSAGMNFLVFVIAAFQIALYMGLAILARQYSVQSQKLRRTTSELHSQMIALEQMTLLKERNRIAGDIHNTVGHQLTTALVQVEATQMLMDKDLSEARKRLSIIREQVRDGLQQLRRSITAINADSEYEDFGEALRRLLEQARSHAGVEVEYQMDCIDGARLTVKKTLYHVILESVTNAIRHGACSRMRVTVVQDNGVIRVSSYNNGRVPKDLTYGFGLKQMKESLDRLGGVLYMRIDEAGWFGLVAEAPLHHTGDDVHGED